MIGINALSPGAPRRRLATRQTMVAIYNLYGLPNLQYVTTLGNFCDWQTVTSLEEAQLISALTLRGEAFFDATPTIKITMQVAP